MDLRSTPGIARSVGIGRPYGLSTKALTAVLLLLGIGAGSAMAQNNPPVINVDAGPFNAFTGQTFTLPVTATDPDAGDTVFLEIVQLPSNATFPKSNAATGTFTWTPGASDLGEHTIRFKAQDASGDAVTAERVINVTPPNQNPVLTVTSPQAASEGVALAFTATTSDPENDAVTLSAAGLPTGALFDTATGAFTWTPDFTQGRTDPYLVTLTAVDARGGSTSQVVTINVANVNRLPVLTVPAAQTAVINTPFTFTVNATDEDDETLTFAATGVPAGANFDPATRAFTWTPAADQLGPFTITFTATDPSGGVDTETVTVNVRETPLPPNNPPTITVPGAQNVNEGAVLSFTVAGADTDADDSVTLSATGLPEGANFDPATGTFTWTPGFTQSAAEPFVVTFTATDEGGLTASNTVAITVADAPRPPDLTVPDAQTVNEGAALSFTVTGTNAEGGDVVLAASDLPEGASFDAETGTFTWTPGFTQSAAEPFTVTFTATNDLGVVATRTVAITVADVDRAPEITVPAAQNVSAGQALTFTVTAVDPDGDAITITPTGLPEGATFDAATGAVTWTPTTAQTRPEPYTVTFAFTNAAGETVAESRTVDIVVGDVAARGTVDLVDEAASGNPVSRPGETFELPLLLTGLEGISNLTFTVDATQVTPAGAGSPELIGVRRGEGLTGGTIRTVTGTGTATVELIGVAASATAGPAAYLRFLVPSSHAGGATVSLNLTDVSATVTDAQGTTVPVRPETADGTTLTIVMLGDLTNDGAVSVTDVTTALRLAVGLDPVTADLLARADVSPRNADGSLGDGRVTISDVTQLLRRAVGLITTF